MGKTKTIHYFSVANMDLRQVGGNECHIINNDDITIILDCQSPELPQLTGIQQFL